MEDRVKAEHLEASGLAALSVCECLLLALMEKGVLKEDEACFVLEDAAASHRLAMEEGRAVALHQAAARLIELIIANSNSVRGTSKLGSLDTQEPAPVGPARERRLE